MSEVFFTSDTHFGHANIIKYCNRPFSCVEEMDKVLLDNINKTVGVHDTLWHLGDFCFGRSDYVSRLKYYRNNIQCKNVILILGNHDRRQYCDYLNFQYVFDIHHIEVQKQLITLCHYAMVVWPKSHYGAWHLYGHSHGSAEAWMNTNLPGRRSLDVGVDNIASLCGEYRPISFSEIQEMMKDKTGFFMDHHQ